MTEKQEENPPESVEEGNEDENDAGYKPPAAMSTAEILSKDTEDESLRRYKEMLLGQAASGKPAVHDPDNPGRMIGKSMALVVDGRTDVEIDLTDVEALKAKTFTIKEGCEYQIRIDFWVQREIVAGLKYIQQTYRKGVRVDTTTLMMGNYPPVEKAHSFTTTKLDAPKGMLARGHYTVKSKFRDDDNNDYAEWKWNFDIKKDWDN